MKEGSPCKRESCDGKLRLSEYVESNVYSKEHNQVFHTERFEYQCGKCGLKHKLEGMK